MKKFYKLIILSLLLVGFVFNARAQNQMLRYADQEVQLGNYHHAADIYTQAFQRKNSYIAAKGAALSFDKLNDYSNSYDWWGKVIDVSSEPIKEDIESYLLSAYVVGRENVAIEKIASLGYAVEEIEQSKVEMILASRDMQSSLTLEYLGELNSSNAADFTGALDEEGNIYFVSDREQLMDSKSMPLIRMDARNRTFNKNIYDWTGREYLKIYRQDKEKNIQEVQFERSDFLHISDPAITKVNGVEYMFFTATRDVTKIKKKKNITVHPELFYGKLEDGKVIGIQDFPYNSFLEHSVVTPFIINSGNKLFFSSDMAGGIGGFDIYFVEFGNDFQFTDPINLGENINSEGDERDPYLFEEKIFFSSNGHEGFGGFDIFQADSKGDGIFLNLINLGAPINSPKDDFGYKKFKKDEIYLSSNRLGDSGLDNIYKLSNQLRQLLVRVVDCDGELVTDFDLNVFQAKGEKVDMKLNSEGAYVGDLEADTKYDLNLAKNGHFSVEDHTITTVDMEPGIIERDYRLIRIPSDLVVFTDIIYYGLDKSDIRNDAEEILANVSSLMDKYKFLELKVASHTDSRASSDYNVALSKRRAEAVRESLNVKGINQDRISLEWYGEDKLITDCPDGVDCSEDDHQLNRRSELSLSIVLKEGSLVPEDFLEDELCKEADLINKIQKDLKIPTIYFDFDKSHLKLEHKMDLERLILLLNNSNINLNLEGHTDIRGSESYNKSLSERRSEIVLKYLIDRNIQKNRLTYEWFGKSKPAVDCLTQDCTPEMHQLNRRTEIKIK
ncbi:OmpA family protein [Belliella sp. DSM 107340]|uniref:OmpA family protein n=1 Tax=Belliella calami TaxID=2923436 RepID=A0ABS9UIU9_9BACT|nr:OmpA family protein [Belliella calami]MCH7396345.1 OmpA family protein [Belliella calami]